MKIELFLLAIETFLTIQYTNGQQRTQNRRIVDRSAGGSTGSGGGISLRRQRVQNTARSTSTDGQGGESRLLGGESGFDPSLTSLVGWYPFGGVFGGFGGDGVINTNVQNRNQVWGRGNFFSDRGLGGTQIAGSDNFDRRFSDGFRQNDIVNNGFEARFLQTDNDQGLPGASGFRGSGGSGADNGHYKVNYGYQTDNDYETKCKNKDCSDYKYDRKGYRHHKGKYDYREDDESGSGGNYHDNLGNDRREYDYKGNQYSNYYQGKKGHSNHHKGYPRKGYYDKDNENKNNYDGYEKKGYSKNEYHGYNDDRRDRQGDNDWWDKDNGYSRHQRYRDSRGSEYHRYRENRNHDDGYSRKGRYDYHDDRKHRDNYGYYKKQYDSYNHEPKNYGTGTKTYDDHGDGNYDNYASQNHRFRGQYLYGIYRDRS